MQWLRWFFGLVLLTISIWLIFLNAATFWKSFVRQEKAPSWIPLLGGGAGVLALFVLPVHFAKNWWLLPLLVDWGSLPGILYTIIWHILRMESKSD